MKKEIPRQPDYDIIARATHSCMLPVLEVLQEALSDYEGDAVDDLGRAKRLIGAMITAAMSKLHQEKGEYEKEQELEKNLLNPAELPTLLEDGEQAKDLYLSKGIRVLDVSQSGKEYSVDLPLDWTIKRSSVTRRWVLFDEQKKRIGSFDKFGRFDAAV